MTNRGIPLSRIASIWMAAVIVLVLATISFVAFDAGRGSTETVGPSTFSRSAIGYAGIADVMRRLGTRVVKSRRDSVASLDPEGVLVVAEPPAGVPAQQMSTLLNARAVLLVLPKWTGEASARRREWLGNVRLLPTSRARAAAQLAGIEVVRVPAVSNWASNEIGPVPAISGQVQLITSSRLRPIVGSASGMLVGELRNAGRRLWVLADPDVMQNHGLAEAENARFSVALIDALRGRNGNVVFDEVVHGFEEKLNSPLKLLFAFPFVLATIQGALAVALLLWATMRRFGAPVTPPRALQAGKQSLIETTANLLDVGGHRLPIVQRYVHTIVRDVARRLHAPAGLSDLALVDWLRRSARVRAAEIDFEEVLRRADETAAAGLAGGTSLAVLARNIFRWKREVMDGGYSRLDRSDPGRGRQGRHRPG